MKIYKQNIIRHFFAMIIGTIILSSCNMNTDAPLAVKENAYKHHVEVVEVLQTTSYTYLLVTEFGEEYWMAVNSMDAKPGEDYYYDSFMEMKDFPSRQLDRVFDRILFVEDISRSPEKLDINMKVPDSHNADRAPEPMEDIQIETAPSGISIAELYKNSNDYADKKVLIRGKVIKVNSNIMNLNWVHLQDGTQDDEHYDLTLTTTEEVNVGDTVTFEGVVNLNKDFGFGYFYALILSEAELK